MSIPWILETVEDPFENDNVLYSLEYLKKNFSVSSLGESKGFLITTDTSYLIIYFAVMEFYCSDEKEILLNCIFHGSGPSGNLRECRHIYWGEEGYTFYPNGILITEAFKKLSEYYDHLS